MDDKLKNIMCNVFRTGKENITEDLEQKNVTFWDSLRHLNLIVELEDQFQISIEPEDLTEMNSYKGIMKVLNRKNKG